MEWDAKTVKTWVSRSAPEPGRRPERPQPRPAPEALRPAPRRRLSTLRVALVVALLAAAFTFYIKHVQATADVLAELQQAERDNLRLHLKYNRLKGERDRGVGPGVVYRRAKALGLEEGLQYGPTVVVAE